MFTKYKRKRKKVKQIFESGKKHKRRNITRKIDTSYIFFYNASLSSYGSEYEEKKS
jgi:uncharacterized membrane protein